MLIRSGYRIIKRRKQKLSRAKSVRFIVSDLSEGSPVDEMNHFCVKNSLSNRVYVLKTHAVIKITIQTSNMSGILNICDISTIGERYRCTSNDAATTGTKQQNVIA